MIGKTLNTKKISGLMLVLIFSGLACRWFPGAVERPGAAIPVTTEAAGALEEDLQAAAEQASATGQIELHLTEEQVTSYAALRLLDQQELAMTNPQVYLRDGKVQIFADLEQDLTTFPLYIEIEPQIVAGGQPRLAIIKVQLGDVAAPDVLVAQIQQGVDQAYASFTGTAGNNFVAESISIADGVLTIKGKVK